MQPCGLLILGSQNLCGCYTIQYTFNRFDLLFRLQHSYIHIWPNRSGISQAKNVFDAKEKRIHKYYIIICNIHKMVFSVLHFFLSFDKPQAAHCSRSFQQLRTILVADEHYSPIELIQIWYIQCSTAGSADIPKITNMHAFDAEHFQFIVFYSIIWILNILNINVHNVHCFFLLLLQFACVTLLGIDPRNEFFNWIKTFFLPFHFCSKCAVNFGTFE